MKRISLESSPCRRVGMSRVCLRDLPEVSRLLETQSRKNLERTSALMPSMVLTNLRQDVKNFTFSPVELVVSLVDRLDTLMTFPTSTDLDTLRLNLCRR